MAGSESLGQQNVTNYEECWTEYGSQLGAPIESES